MNKTINRALIEEVQSIKRTGGRLMVHVGEVKDLLFDGFIEPSGTVSCAEHDTMYDDKAELISIAASAYVALPDESKANDVELGALLIRDGAEQKVLIDSGTAEIVHRYRGAFDDMDFQHHSTLESIRDSYMRQTGDDMAMARNLYTHTVIYLSSMVSKLLGKQPDEDVTYH